MRSSNQGKIMFSRLKQKFLQLNSRLEDNKSLMHMKSIIQLRPVCIAVQAYDNCNARCVFCARRKITPSNSLMSIELFGKLCEDYSEIGGGHLGFSPLIADPLIDPLILRRFELLHRSYPNITPNIFTNGIALSQFTDDQIKIILVATNHVDISVGGFNRKDYYDMFGVDKFDEVWSSLLRIYKISKELSRSLNINVHVRTSNRSKIMNSKERQKLLEMGFNCSDIVSDFSNWGGMISDGDLPVGAKIHKRDNSNCGSQCFSPMYNMMIMSDGKVMACGCMDANKEMEVGDINEMSIVEIWLGDKMKKIRESFESPITMFSLCKSCAYYTSYKTYYTNPGLIEYDPKDDFWSKLK